MNTNLSFEPAALLVQLRRFAPQLIGLALIGVFAYTGWVVNEAINVKPADVGKAMTTVDLNKDAIKFLSQ